MTLVGSIDPVPLPPVPPGLRSGDPGDDLIDVIVTASGGFDPPNPIGPFGRLVLSYTGGAGEITITPTVASYQTDSGTLVIDPDPTLIGQTITFLPDPATALLAALGAAGLMARGRRSQADFSVLRDEALVAC